MMLHNCCWNMVPKGYEIVAEEITDNVSICRPVWPRHSSYLVLELL